MPFINGQKGLYVRDEVIELLKEANMDETIATKGIYLNDELNKIINNIKTEEEEKKKPDNV